MPYARSIYSGDWGSPLEPCPRSVSPPNLLAPHKRDTHIHDTHGPLSLISPDSSCPPFAHYQGKSSSRRHGGRTFLDHPLLTRCTLASTRLYQAAIAANITGISSHVFRLPTHPPTLERSQQNHPPIAPSNISRWTSPLLSTSFSSSPQCTFCLS